MRDGFILHRRIGRRPAARPLRGESSVETGRYFFPTRSIAPEAKVRVLLYYPLSNGRNFQELLRLLIAMQTSDKFNCATPANWQPGDDVIIPPPGSWGTAEQRVRNAGDDYQCLDWFLCLKKLSKDKLNLP